MLSMSFSRCRRTRKLSVLMALGKSKSCEQPALAVSVHLTLVVKFVPAEISKEKSSLCKEAIYTSVHDDGISFIYVSHIQSQ